MTAPATARQAPPAGRYAIDPAGSSVTFVTRHMFGLAPVRGTIAVTSGTLAVAGTAEDSSAEATMAAATFSTRNFMRDPQVRSRLFLHVRRYPAISFRSTAIRPGGDGWTVSGVLTVKEQPAPVELAVTDISAEGSTFVLRASGTVDRYAHGITALRGMAARYLSVQVTIRATRA